jgi:formylglycine-generating enzyme required for sulfatase activity
MEYTQTLAATGDPYISWSLDSGALPTGLTLYSSGTIFGTPTTAGTFTFTVKATNDAGNATKQLSIVIAVAPTITTTTLPNGKVGTEYITELSVTGDPTITWSLDSGELPDGLTFYENGYIYGTPTKAGTFTFTVKATNSAGSGTKQLSLTIDGAPIITTTTLPDGVVGTVYEYGYRLTATGGTPIEWSLGNGISPVGWYSLPATGLSLNSSGYIFGTPTTAGTFTFTVQATNTVGSDTKQLSITITGDTPTITTEKLLNWIAGTAYSQTLAAVSTTPVTWSLDSGTLPTGLSLAGTGIITGTPTAAGTFTFTVKATNAEGSDTKSLSIKIAASIEMVQIQDGVFNMGSPPSEPDRDSNESWHFVVISEFKMGKYQVTQGQYEVVMGNNPSYFTTPVSPETSTVNRPVERVSWYDAIIFCNKLSMMKGLNPVYRINGSTDPDDWGDVPTDWYSPRKDAWDAVQMLTSSNGYRLPTEAQWEYACRAGTTTAYNTGDTISDSTGWYLNNSGNRTHSVGEKPSNPWGLYDMHGNVFEWCWDWYGDYPNVSGLRDPTGADSGSLRVYRGGSWGMFKEVLRSAYRNYNPPHYEFNMVGFRVVLPAQ